MAIMCWFGPAFPVTMLYRLGFRLKSVRRSCELELTGPGS
jgi:hypothetical protein